MRKTKELILYRNIKYRSLFDGFTRLMAYCDGEPYERQEAVEQYYACLHGFVEIGESHGFTGNLWHNFLILLLVRHENAYSVSCEIQGEAPETLRQIAGHDFAIFQTLFDFDLYRMETTFGVTGIDFLTHYVAKNDENKLFHHRIRKEINRLRMALEREKDPVFLQRATTQFYQTFGVGDLGLHKAFRIGYEEGEAKIVPITNIACVTLEDLVGYETAKRKLLDNTEAFVRGKAANNCLLYGDAGTGKSSCVKAIVNAYYDKGLRIIEMYKSQFPDFHAVVSQIKNRNYKFILYMDDLSFEDFEVEYKYLKAAMEGGLEQTPQNILIYATSNRRHIVREKFSDKRDLADDLHNNDTVSEKLSLAARFGVQIYFGAPDKWEYRQIVKELAKKNQISMNEETLLLEADKWELSHGGRSGRTARQFINYLLGKEGEP